MRRILSLITSLLFIISFGLVNQAFAADKGPDITNDDVGDSIQLRPGELPSVRLTPATVYHILVAEFSAQSGDYATTANIYSMLSKLTLDPRLAKLGFQAAMMANDIELAYSTAKQWLSLDPNDAEANASSMALAARSGETESLINALKERIETAPNKTQAIGHAFVLLSKMPDKETALNIMDKVIPDSERNTHVAHVTLSDLAYEAGDMQRAYSEALSALNIKADSDMAIQRVIEYGYEIDKENVVKIAKTWLGQNPESRKTYLRLLNQYVMHGDFDVAKSSIKSMRSRWPEDFDLLYTEAEINIKAKDYGRAKKLLNEYISVQEQRRLSLDDSVTNALSQVSDARLLLVGIAEKEQDIAQAIYQLDKITEPGFAFRAQMHKAVLLGKTGDLAAATKTIDASKPSSDEEKTTAALTMASIYRGAGRSDSALKTLVKADSDIPNSAAIKYDLAMMYVQKGETSKFDALMRAVIRLEPENANAYNSLGYTYVDQNRRLDEARELLEYALELDPNSPYILDSVGWYFFRVNDLESALIYLQRAYNIMPEPDVAAHYGEALWLSEQKDKALEVWEKSFKENSDSDVLNKTLKKYKIKF